MSKSAKKPNKPRRRAELDPKHIRRADWILGAGFTGLAAADASGAPVLESANYPGGICASYYLRPRSARRLPQPPATGAAYRFEHGGGHWIFGAKPGTVRYIRKFAALRSYTRSAAIYPLAGASGYIPYPLQQNLLHLDPLISRRAAGEMKRVSGDPNLGASPKLTMKRWLGMKFGPSLCRAFFYPFHEKYTAGLYRQTGVQDSYKTPNGRAPHASRGAAGWNSKGYNLNFYYPVGGLDGLARRMAESSAVYYGKKIARIDAARRRIFFEAGDEVGYRRIISTLPLNHLVEMTGIGSASELPFNSVLVLNIGATQGPDCPPFHWIYFADSRSGFHRVGFYSNVDPSFAPASKQKRPAGRVALYVERSFVGGRRLSEAEQWHYIHEALRELKDMGYIRDVEVCDPSWIDVAYTWRWAGASALNGLLSRLEQSGIYSTGRYGAWNFQGIAESIEDGQRAARFLL